MPTDRSAAWPYGSTSTADYTGDAFLLRVRRGDDCWVVSEDGSAVYGAGRTLLEAMADLWHAALALPDVVGDKAAPRLQRQVEIARSLTEVRAMQPSDKPTAATVTAEAKRLLGELTPKQRELLDRCTCGLARPYWHSFHREGCPLAR